MKKLSDVNKSSVQSSVAFLIRSLQEHINPGSKEQHKSKDSKDAPRASGVKNSHFKCETWKASGLEGEVAATGCEMIYFNKTSNVRRFCWIFPPCCEGNKDQRLSNEPQLDLKERRKARKKERKWRKASSSHCYVCMRAHNHISGKQSGSGGVKQHIQKTVSFARTTSASQTPHYRYPPPPISLLLPWHPISFPPSLPPTKTHSRERTRTHHRHRSLQLASLSRKWWKPLSDSRRRRLTSFR